MTENSLFKGFTTKSVRNYDQKQSGKFGSYGRWRCGSTGHESYTAWGIPWDATVKLTRLLLVVISNTFCSKTFKLFCVTLTYCCFSVSSCCFFHLLLWTKLVKKTFPKLHSYAIPSRLCIPTISWKFVCPLVKHPGTMSFKCHRSVESALHQNLRTPKLYVILKRIITKGMTYTQTATKSISLFKAYESLKSFPPVHSLNFTSYPIPMFSVLGLKFMLRSKFYNKYNLMQKIMLKICCSLF